ncbi:LysR family transcriptional regulator [Acidocella sp.]|uniref:LysR family transcriptional regulator n=1 Tax=Acidocella sp. TaxID=50710 RepID=UPI002612E55F|nr:LysR family transcriptional regulator [Acidocella sp.]
MEPPLKPRWLRVALAIFEHGSALRAAETVHLSAPAVLGALGGLEAALGETLFERHAGGMRPTEAGTLFCRRIKTALAELREAETALHTRKRFAGMVDLAQLRALLALQEAPSVSAAARTLGLAQPTLYRAARELEALAGVTLWERAGRGLRPTWAARRLGEHAGRMQAELRLGVDELREARGLKAGRLYVGALPLARSTWLPEALARTLGAYPRAEIDIMDGPYDEQRTALRAGRIDLILGPLRAETPEIAQEWLFADPLTIVIGPHHALAGTREVSRATLDALDWILPPRGTPSRGAFEAYLESQGARVPVDAIACNSLITIRALLRATPRAAVLSKRQIAAELARGELVAVGAPIAGSAQPVGIATRPGLRPSGLVGAFLQHARAVAGEIGGGEP